MAKMQVIDTTPHYEYQMLTGFQLAKLVAERTNEGWEFLAATSAGSGFAIEHFVWMRKRN